MKIYISNEEETFSYSIEKEKITIGRSETCDFVVPHNELSRNHCELYVEDEKISILDLGSKNGVFVDGARIPVNVKVPINLQSVIMVSTKLNLSFMRRPGQTNLGLTGQIGLEKIIPKELPLRSRRKK